MTDIPNEEALLELLVDLHRPHARQGPGSHASTLLALELARIDRHRPLRIADLGCGTGSSALVLAEHLDGEIVAVDLFEPFLEELRVRADARNMSARITAVQGSIDDLPFDDGEFDLIWSEGAIYNIGFEAGVNLWRRYLRPGGTLVASEITWLTESRPTALEEHWLAEYPEIETASAKLAILENAGFSPAGYFTLPDTCWREEYYEPVLADLDEFRTRHNSPLADQIAEAERAEATLYETYSDYFSYGVYIAQRVD